MEKFNWGNLIGNLLQLAAEIPNNPDLIADILSKLTRHTFLQARGEGNATRHEAPNPGGGAENGADIHIGDSPSRSEEENVQHSLMDILAHVAGIVEQNNQISNHQELSTDGIELIFGCTPSKKGDDVQSINGPSHLPTNSHSSNQSKGNYEFDTSSIGNESTEERINDDDDDSFKSACQSHTSIVGLHDFEESQRFPNGTLCYVVDTIDFKTSWCMLQYTQRPVTKNGVKKHTTAAWGCINVQSNHVYSPVILSYQESHNINIALQINLTGRGFACPMYGYSQTSHPHKRHS